MKTSSVRSENWHSNITQTETKKPGPKKWLGEFLGKKKAKTKMAFNGIKKDENLANLIAYLKEATK